VRIKNLPSRDPKTFADDANCFPWAPEKSLSWKNRKLGAPYEHVISVIIPTLNEGEHLAATLERVRANSARHEMIVVDGGSADDTLAIASAGGARTAATSVANRASQMNAGAEAALGNVFLFLHADTRLRATSLAQVENALRDERVVGGGFARRFDSDSAFLRVTCALATIRCSLFGLFLGDQGIFVRRTVFQQVGGFPRLSLFEDVDFARRLARLGRTVTLRPGVISSGRRFVKRGPIRTTCRDFWLACRYVRGWRPIPPDDAGDSAGSPDRVGASSHPASASNRAVSRTAE
jgi:rSAM/selenodomain-associated transferase 2